MIYKNLKKIMNVTNLLMLLPLVKVLAISSAIILIPGCKSSSSKSNGTENVLQLITGPDNPRNSEGDFITLKDGRILYIYTHYTGSSSDDHASAFLAGRYSNDKGKTWTREDVKILDQEGTMNVMSVSLLRLQNGEIAFFYLRKNSTTDCIPVLRLSNDETKTWSEPIRCITDREGYFVLNNNRVIQLKNGRLVLAVAMHGIPGDPEFHSVGRLWSYYSDDNGRTWKASAEVPNPGNKVTQEPGLIELKNGDIMMYVRTTAGVQYFSYSKDLGATWSAVEPGNLKSPCSPAVIARIPSTGDLLVVWNDNWVDQKRTPLNMAISKDEGKTWINNKIIADKPDGVYCYPALNFIDKYVLLGYSDWFNSATTLVRMDIDWIYN